MIRRLAIAGVGVVAVAILAAPGPGAADEKRAALSSKCPKGAMCVWAGKNYQGRKLTLRKTGEITNRIYNRMNDKVSSAKNRYKHLSYLYENIDGGGQVFCVESGGNIPDFAAFQDEFNNDASSSFLPDKQQPNCL